MKTLGNMTLFSVMLLAPVVGLAQQAEVDEVTAVAPDASPTEEPAAAAEPSPASGEEPPPAAEESATAGDTAAVADAEPALEADAPDRHVLSVGLKAGAVFPQLTSTFGTTFAVGVDAGYRLPFLGSRFGLVAGLGYSQPTASGDGDDPRLGGSYSWQAVQRQLIVDVGAIARLNEEQSDWNLGLVLGPRLLFLFTTVDGEGGGEPFGEHFEPASSMGLFVGGQGEYRLGPGAIVGEVDLGTSFQNLRSTGDLTLVSIAALIGYRFDFAL